jgi:hypothetical protein
VFPLIRELAAVKPQPGLQVIPNVDVQEWMPLLHRQEGGIKRGRIQVVSKLGHHGSA